MVVPQERVELTRAQVIKTQDTKAIKSEITIGAVEWDLGDEVELWWPVREGKQTRYQVKVELLSEVSFPIVDVGAGARELCSIRATDTSNSRGRSSTP